MLGIFGFGVFIQSLISIRQVFVKNPSKLKYIFLALGGSLLGLLPGKHEEVYIVPLHLLLAFIFYAGIFAWLFKNELIARINEQVLLQLTLIVYYSIFVSPHIPNGLKYFLGLVLVIPSLLILYLCLVERIMTFGWKVYFWIYYLLLNILLISSYFSFGVLQLSMVDVAIRQNPFAIFIAGTTFFYLIENATYIYQLIPYPGKHQTFAEKLKEVKQFAAFLALEYDDQQLEPFHTLCIILLQGGFLVGNALFHVIDDVYVISFSLLLTQLLVGFFTSRYDVSQPRIIYESPVE